MTIEPWAHLGDTETLLGPPIELTSHVLEAASLQLADGEKAKPVWIQLGTVGQFAGHPQGPFELNDQIFQQIVRNFKASPNRQIPIDFNHCSEQDPTSGSIPDRGTPAQGWIGDVKIQGTGLFGLVDWGELARSYIKNKNYKYISPAIRFTAKDRVTGKPIGARLTSAGLTNQPFLEGMQPLAASTRGAGAREAPAVTGGGDRPISMSILELAVAIANKQRIPLAEAQCIAFRMAVSAKS